MIHRLDSCWRASLRARSFAIPRFRNRSLATISRTTAGAVKGSNSLGPRTVEASLRAEALVEVPWHGVPSCRPLNPSPDGGGSTAVPSGGKAAPRRGTSAAAATRCGSTSTGCETVAAGCELSVAVYVHESRNQVLLAGCSRHAEGIKCCSCRPRSRVGSVTLKVQKRVFPAPANGCPQTWVKPRKSKVVTDAIQ